MTDRHHEAYDTSVGGVTTVKWGEGLTPVAGSESQSVKPGITEGCGNDAVPLLNVAVS